VPGSVLYYPFQKASATSPEVWKKCFTPFTPLTHSVRAELDATCHARLVLAVATNIQGTGPNCEADLVWACNLKATPRTCSSKTKVPCYAFQSLQVAPGVGSTATIKVRATSAAKGTTLYNFIGALAIDIPHLANDISWVMTAVGSEDSLREANTFVAHVKACTDAKDQSAKETAQAALDKLWTSRLGNHMSPDITIFDTIQKGMEDAKAYDNLVCESIPVDAESRAEMLKVAAALNEMLDARRAAKIDAAIAIGSKCLSVLCSALLVAVDLGAPGMGSSISGAVAVMKEWNGVMPGANQAGNAAGAAVTAVVGTGIVDKKQWKP